MNRDAYYNKVKILKFVIILGKGFGLVFMMELGVWVKIIKVFKW